LRAPKRHVPEFEKSDSYLDLGEFRYILWINHAFQKIREVPGHIVEVGVARGRNAILFGNLLKLYSEDDVRNYFGFDTFSGYSEADYERDPHLPRGAWTDLSFGFVSRRLVSAKVDHCCFLYEGDVRETAPRFLNETTHKRFTPGNFRCALLYIDCNAHAPALAAMRLFRPFMAPGGIVCIDEKRQGGETRALIEFCREAGLSVIRDAVPVSAPAYAVIA
jgi:hypothetical protein